MPRKDLESYSAKVGYRKHPGMVMWLFHRVSGVIIGLYLVFHVLGVSGVVPFLSAIVKEYPGLYRLAVAVVSVLFVLHAANGIRIVLMEFCSSAERKKFLPHVLVVVALVVTLGTFFAVKIGYTG